MTTTHRNHPRRRLDVPSLVLMIIGVASGAFCLWLIGASHVSALVLVPSIIAATIGASHLVKSEASRR